MRQIRLIDLGTVPAARSHVLLHALSVGVSAGQQDTLALVVPDRRYVSIGVYQECRREIDAAWCASHDAPIYRRHIGGGAIVFDPGQQLVMTVFHRRSAAISATRMYQSLLSVIVETYRKNCVDVHYVPIDRVYAGRARMGRCAVGRLNNAIAFLSHIVYTRDDEFARGAIRGDDSPHCTSMAEELEVPPDRDVVRSMLVAEFERQFEADIVIGGLSEREIDEIGRLETELDRPEWREQVVCRIDALRSGAGPDAAVLEGEHAAEGGTIRATIRATNGKIGEIVLSGDFSFYEDHLYGLEQAFRDVNLDWDDLMTVAENYYLSYAVDSPGTNPADWVTAITNAR